MNKQKKKIKINDIERIKKRKITENTKGKKVFFHSQLLYLLPIANKFIATSFIQYNDDDDDDDGDNLNCTTEECD